MKKIISLFILFNTLIFGIPVNELGKRIEIRIIKLNYNMTVSMANKIFSEELKDKFIIDVSYVHNSYGDLESIIVIYRK